MAERDTFLYEAKLAEQAERYDEMVECMKKLAKLGGTLLTEERNLLSVGFKNVIGTRRASWRVISAIACKEKSEKDETIPKEDIIKTYRGKIEKELTDICDDILNLLDDTLIENSKSDSEAQVFYYKMKGDYHRYMAEFQTIGDDRKKCSESSLGAYTQATEAAKGLKSTHPICLGLALNFSVFYYEILNEPSKAIELARKAFDDAVAELNGLPDDSYKDSTLILQLLRDNLTLWTSEDRDEKVVDDEEQNPNA